MKNLIQLVAGVVLCLGLVGYYGWLFTSSRQVPKAEPISQTKYTLDEKALQDLRLRSLNGNLPITIKDGELDNSNPFAP